MRESKPGGTGADDSSELEERQSEATSDETLSDIEDTETEVESSESDEAPSPDGALDEIDEIKDAGPM